MFFRFYVLLLVIYDSFSIQIQSNDLLNHPAWDLLPQKCGVGFPSDRIIGGLDASLGEFPWMVRIGSRTASTNYLRFLCGGSLLTSRYIISAMHCVEIFEVLGSPVARIGENYIDQKNDCNENVCAPPAIDVDIEDFIFFNKTETRPLYYDIVLGKLKKPIEFTDFIQPICLPTIPIIDDIANILHVNESDVLTAGWGRTDMFEEAYPDKLQYVSLLVVLMDICIQKFPDYTLDEDRQICVGKGIEKDSCSGDSGGPLMKMLDVEGVPKYYLFGLVSVGMAHCGKDPGIYVNIAFYMKWILDNVAKN